MKPDENLIVDSTQYQDPSLQALKDKVKAAGDAANAMMETATDATGQALEDATEGQAQAASEAVKALQAELAALQKQAADKVDEMKTTAEETGNGRMGGGAGGGSLGKASAATFNLASLAQSVGGSFQSKQLSAMQKQNAIGEAQVDKLEGLIASVDRWSLHHT
jgi:hypothetical protein